jgi:hypothetical protein
MAVQRLGALILSAMLGRVATADSPALTATGAMRLPWAGRADWTMTIDAEGRVAGAAKGCRCSLTGEQRAELTRLLAALPVGEPEYRFGDGNPDTHTRFTLAIRRSGMLHTYAYWRCNEKPCRDEPAIDSVERVSLFLRGLCQRTLGGTS